MPGRFDVPHEIEQLDPERDHQRIVHLSFGYDFPWDSIRALEIALYRTYCVPSISALLDRTGEFRERHPAPLRRHLDPRRRDVRMGLRERPRQGSARADELGARPLQDRERRFSLRALDVHLRAGSVDRRVWLAADVPQRAARLLLLLARNRHAHGHHRTFPRRTRRSRRGAAPTNGSSSASPRPTSASARRRAICSSPGSRASSRRSFATASTRCSTSR